MRHGSWILPATLAGALTPAGVVLTARAQQPASNERTEPDERNEAIGRKDAAKANVKEDSQDIRVLRAKVNWEKEKLRADERRFGRNSAQAQADRAQLQKDQAALKAMQQDSKNDASALRDHRFHRHGFRGGRF